MCLFYASFDGLRRLLAVCAFLLKRHWCCMDFFCCVCNGIPICAPSSRPALTKCAELKKQHPELVVGGFTLAVALPSALGEYPELKFLVASELVLQAQIVF